MDDGQIALPAVGVVTNCPESPAGPEWLSVWSVTADFVRAGNTDHRHTVDYICKNRNLVRKADERTYTLMEKVNGYRTCSPTSRGAWRKWLATNTSSEPVCLVLYRKTSKRHNLSYADAVEEALCFGWIDNRGWPRNGESSYLRFAPRKLKSKWSKLNVERSERLIRDGLMMKAGQVFIDEAKKTGAWLAAGDADNIPPDLEKAFKKNKTARKNFQAFPPFARRMINGWILDAKRRETRDERVKKTVALAAKNIRSRP